MIKFVIIEDDKKIQEIIKKLLRKISIENDIEMQISFYSAYNDKLANCIKENLYRKVYIIDIELEGSLSGIDIAQKLRENDWDSEIIFITSHDKMFETVYRNVLDVFDFIEKFHNLKTRLEKDITTIIKQKFDKKMLKISTRNIDLEIYLKNILYITRDKDDRKVIIHTNEVDFKVTNSLKEIGEKLDNRFVKSHRSCIVNKEHVVEYNYSQNYFQLDNGMKIDLLSKKYRKEIENNE